jgi:hypothetical protein
MKLDLSIVQYLAFPVMLFVVSRLSLAGRRIPGFLLLLAFVCAAAGGSLAYSFHNDPERGFLIAKILDDNFETETRIFREKVNAEIGSESGVRASRFYRSLASSREATDFLLEHPEANAVVWGGERWMTISFAHREPLDLLNAPLAPLFEGRINMKLVSSIPAIGLSFRPDAATAKFIALAMRGSLTDKEGKYDSSSDFDLLQAATMAGGWSSGAHRAYIWWQLGNRHLLRVLYSGSVDRADLDCALRYYAAGHHLLRWGDNVALRAALLNNEAVARYAIMILEGRRHLRPAIRKGLERAMRSGREPNLYKVRLDGALVARENLYRIGPDLRERRDGAVRHGPEKRRRAHPREAHRKHKKKRNGAGRPRHDRRSRH